MEIGERILALMQQKNITYREMEERTGISRSTLNRWFAKGKPIPFNKLETIAAALGIGQDELLGWKQFDIATKTHFAVLKVLEEQGNTHALKVEQLADVASELSDADIDRLISIAKAWTGG